MTPAQCISPTFGCRLPRLLIELENQPSCAISLYIIAGKEAQKGACQARRKEVRRERTQISGAEGAQPSLQRDEATASTGPGILQGHILTPSLIILEWLKVIQCQCNMSRPPCLLPAGLLIVSYCPGALSLWPPHENLHCPKRIESTQMDARGWMCP